MADDKKYVEVVKKSLEQLDKYQKNAELIISAFNQFANIDIKVKEYTDEEKLRAAYALNLCTVSVSQIIDYNDIEILEQEYEIILNNLNLENMPKDEALLNILKRILDVITFFRIQDGDKKFIDKEYQHKMKNAVWAAVPNFGLIVAGGTPITMAISLASQVGIGYMNYRRLKAENQLEEERANWKLQRAAIEQLNGLCRELFDVAWRLADEYKFPDEYRLTERQIKQYNTILMDTDSIRKYERLDSIKDKFKAYIPFWYNFGHTANQIAQNPKFSVSTRNHYSAKAISCFKTFFRLNDKNLLREDQIAAACALEYIDLLSVENDAEKINKLIEIAVRNAGGQWDVLQLCAIAYLKNKNTDKAAVILRQLVNEEYNTVLNAQILSNIYVSNFFYKQDKETALTDYEILETRVEKEYLFPIPRDGVYDINKLNKEFSENQHHILKMQYHSVLKEFIRRYTIKYNKIFIIEDKTKEYNDTYFLDSDNERRNRLQDLEDILNNNRRKKQYFNRLKDDMIIYNLFEVINEIFIKITKLKIIEDVEFLELILTGSIIRYKDTFVEFMKSLSVNESEDVNVDIVSKVCFKDIIYDFFKELDKQLIEYIDKCENMSDIAYAESELHKFCISENLSYPEILHNNKNKMSENLIDKKVFSPRLLGVDCKEIEKIKEMKAQFIEIINNYKENLITDEKAELIIQGTDAFDYYFSEANTKLDKWKKSTVAIIASKGKVDSDLMITLEGIVVIKLNIIQKFLPYNEIKLKNDVLVGVGYDFKIVDSLDLIIGMVSPVAYMTKKAYNKITDFSYKNKSVNLKELYDLISNLNKIVSKDSLSDIQYDFDCKDYYDFLDDRN